MDIARQREILRARVEQGYLEAVSRLWSDPGVRQTVQTRRL